MKRHLFLLTATALFWAACTQNSSSNKEERNRQTALESVRAMGNHDTAALVRNAIPGMVDYGDGSTPPIRGVDSIKMLVASFLAAFPDVKRDRLKAVADGEWVMIWGTWSGTFKNDLMGIKATGKYFSDVPDVDIFRFNEEGKITEHHNVQSPHTFLQKAGAVLQ